MCIKFAYFMHQKSANWAPNYEYEDISGALVLILLTIDLSQIANFNVLFQPSIDLIMMLNKCTKYNASLS